MRRRFQHSVSLVALAGAIATLCFCGRGRAADAPKQYKRVHQDLLAAVVRGNVDQAADRAVKFVEQYPEDAESRYMLAVIRAQQGEVDEAAASMHAAIELGLSPGRFVGGTRTKLAALRQHPQFVELLDQWRHRPVHGPLLGCVTGTGARIWVRTAGEADVRVRIGTAADLHGARDIGPVRTSKTADFTAVVVLDGLESNTEYYYRVEVDGAPDDRDSSIHRFRTAPERGKPARFRIAFGGGAGFVPQHEHVWDTIAAQRPDVLLLLGDNVYSDMPTSPEMQHYCYYRRQSRDEFRRLTAVAATYAIWDDHDFGTNDCQGGPAVERPAWKRPVFEVFRNNWNNPYYGGGDARPGCWFDFYRGDVHFIMLDGRYYRNHVRRDPASSTMLGPAQKRWLLDTLSGSTGRIKFVCSPVPWTFKAKGESPDTWNGFRVERAEIFDFLSAHEIGGVVLMSADRHRSDLWKIERDGAYDLFEFNSSRLTNQHVHPTMADAEFSYNRRQSFGLVDVDTTLDDPAVTYRIVNIDGEEVFRFTLPLGRLTPSRP